MVNEIPKVIPVVESIVNPIVESIIEHNHVVPMTETESPSVEVINSPEIVSVVNNPEVEVQPENKTFFQNISSAVTKTINKLSKE